MSNPLKLLAFLLLSLSVARAARDEYSQMAAQVNSLSLSWSAALAPDIDYDDDAALISRLGAVMMPAGPRALQAIANATVATTAVASLDLRTKYPACSSLKLIRNQGACGSCWAFSTMNSLSDRYCIANYNAGVPKQFFFAAEDVMECCATCYPYKGKPCLGGYTYLAFQYAATTGVVSGEAFGNTALCKPYFLNVAAWATSIPASITCKSTCANAALAPTRTKISSATRGVGVAAMIAELNKGGTIVGSFTVYQDLYSYRSGIYFRVTGAALGGHAVRIIGYGTANGVDYWLVANTWGTGWGESGYFRMRRGTNEGGIETNYYAAGVV